MKLFSVLSTLCFVCLTALPLATANAQSQAFSQLGFDHTQRPKRTSQKNVLVTEELLSKVIDQLETQPVVHRRVKKQSDLTAIKQIQKENVSPKTPLLNYSKTEDSRAVYSRAGLKTPTHNIQTTAAKAEWSFTSATSTTSVKKVKATTIKRPIPKTIRVRLEGDEQFIIPAMQGPETDTNQNGVITTRTNWSGSKKDGCGKPNNHTELEHKAAALHELVERLTGDGEYYASQCKKACNIAETTGVMTGLTLASEDPAIYRITSLGTECRYQLAMKDSKSWQVLHGVSVHCSCFPTSTN